MLTFLNACFSLCVCSNAATSIAISMAHQVQMLSLHFDELSKTQQKCQQVEHGQMYTLKECNAHIFECLFLCVCSNAATSIAISMAHQVQMLSLHFDELSKTQQKCQQVEHGQMYTLKECNAHVFGFFSVCGQMPQHPLPFPGPIRCKCFRFIFDGLSKTQQKCQQVSWWSRDWCFSILLKISIRLIFSIRIETQKKINILQYRFQ